MIDNFFFFFENFLRVLLLQRLMDFFFERFFFRDFLSRLQRLKFFYLFQGRSEFRTGFLLLIFLSKKISSTKNRSKDYSHLMEGIYSFDKLYLYK